ncbi:MAG: hypothetical protein R3B70_11950 [Polyangiaceae bacterium]
MNIDDLLAYLKMFGPPLAGAVAGSIITLLAKARSDKKQSKVLRLETDVQRFSLGSADTGDPEMKVSFKGRSYAALSEFTVILSNIGATGVDGQEIVLALPRAAVIVERSFMSAPVSIAHTVKERATKTTTEVVLSFKRLAPGENAAYSLILDGVDPKDIVLFPRGPDGVEYVGGRGVGSAGSFENDLRNLMAFLAMYVLMGFVPFVSAPLQAAVVIGAIPIAVRFASRLRQTSGRPNAQGGTSTAPTHDIGREGGTLPPGASNSPRLPEPTSKQEEAPKPTPEKDERR